MQTPEESANVCISQGATVFWAKVQDGEINIIGRRHRGRLFRAEERPTFPLEGRVCRVFENLLPGADSSVTRGWLV